MGLLLKLRRTAKEASTLASKWRGKVRPFVRKWHWKFPFGCLTFRRSFCQNVGKIRRPLPAEPRNLQVMPRVSDRCRLRLWKSITNSFLRKARQKTTDQPTSSRRSTVAHAVAIFESVDMMRRRRRTRLFDAAVRRRCTVAGRESSKTLMTMTELKAPWMRPF